MIRPASRLSPPEHLSPDAQVVWREAIRGEAADHFDRGAMRQGLERYCELTATLRGFEAELTEISGLDPRMNLDTRMRLAKLIADLGGRASALALRLRLTPASRERVTDDKPRSPYDTID